MIPFAHQGQYVEDTWQRVGFAVFWEPRVGKSLPQVLTAFRQYDAGLIDCVIVLAPQGVHHDWAKDVIVEAIQDNYLGHLEHQILDWMSNQAHSVRFTKRAEDVLKNTGLVFICADSNGLTSQRLRDYLESVVKKRKCLLVLDEGHFFKNPQAQRTKFVMRLSKKCVFKRDLTGTPLTSPFDLWSQFNILDPTILGERFVPFKTKYGIFETKFFGPRAVKVVSGYKELDDLKARIEPHSSWRTFDETFPNNPGVLPAERAYFEMSPEYIRAYTELKKEYILQLEKGEVIVTSPLVMMLRLSQVARGFVMTDNGVQPIPGDNNATKRLVYEIEKRPAEKIVVWCHFIPDVDRVLEELTKVGFKCVRHDGTISQEQRTINKDLFQDDPSIRAVVGTPATGGVGKDFSAGSTVIFYSHSFNINERIQAFNRVRGVNQTRPVQQVDLCAIGTVDERCMQLLRRRVDVISQIQDRSVLLNMLKSESEELMMTNTPSLDVADVVLPEDDAADVIERMIQNGE